jgi:predicted component of type VI protein secretion system
VENTTEHKADTLAFKKSPVRVGRNTLNDLQLDEPFVSQWHAVIRFSQERTSYLDLGSTNRTLIDGRPTARNIEVPIGPDTDIRIGPLRLHLLRGPAPPELFGRRRKSAFGPRPDALDAGPSTVLLRPSLLGAALGAAPHDEPSMKRSPPASGTRTRVHPLAAASAAAAVSPAAADAALHTDYLVYREIQDKLRSAVRQRLDTTPAEERSGVEQELRARFPELLGEPLAQHSVREPGGAHCGSGSWDVSDWLSRLTGGTFPPPGGNVDTALAMERVGSVLEVFSHAFVELRRAQAQFCHEMSLEESTDPESFLHDSEDPEALLAYLLGSPTEGDARLMELSRALADFTLHQVGLVGATVEGARKLVELLGPESLASVPDPPDDSPALAPQPALSRLWPWAARSLWRRYLAHHYSLVESDRFVRELFGREFARRYYSVTGGGGR